MLKMILAVMVAGTTLSLAAAPATAQPGYSNSDRYDCQRSRRYGESITEHRRWQRDCLEQRRRYGDRQPYPATDCQRSRRSGESTNEYRRWQRDCLEQRQRYGDRQPYPAADCQRSRRNGESLADYRRWQRDCLQRGQSQGQRQAYPRMDCYRPRRGGESSSDYRRFQRNCLRVQQMDRDDGLARRDWRQYRQYDHDRPEPGRDRYYADDYHRDGRYYRERPLRHDERIYRGRDGRYYCRRDDGTTGLIVGGAAGALIGNQLDRGESSLLGTLIGGVAGALIGREVDRSELRCR